MRQVIKITFLALLGGLVLLAALQGPRGPVEGDSILGARIYNNWMLALDLPPPAGNHPLWENQTSNPRNGVATWRCVECHGWDYKGAEGAYGPASSHYTGFPGLDDAVGASQEEVVAWLDGSSNPDHNFLAYMPLSALDDLAAFLRTQQVDVDLIINPDNGAALGDWVQGWNLYHESCESCHGVRGADINFGTDTAPAYIGDLAISDPWRTVHMIRFGDVAGGMLGSEELGWSLSTVADVLAYVQRLPRANPALGTPTPGAAEENQGEMGPIIWAGFGILLLFVISLGWDLYQQRLNQRRG